jgi:hypothetical protein
MANSLEESGRLKKVDPVSLSNGAATRREYRQQNKD